MSEEDVVYFKTIAVIKSCKSSNQVRTAKAMVENCIKFLETDVELKSNVLNSMIDEQDWNCLGLNFGRQTNDSTQM